MEIDNSFKLNICERADPNFSIVWLSIDWHLERMRIRKNLLRNLRSIRFRHFILFNSLHESIIFPIPSLVIFVQLLKIRFIVFSRNIKLPCEDQGDILKPFKSFVCICEFIQSYISNFITAIQELFGERTIPFTM